MNSLQYNPLTVRFMLGCKLKMLRKNNRNSPKERFSTEYGEKIKQSRNKLTYGCRKYEDIKCMHQQNCQSHKPNENNQCTFQPNFSAKKKSQQSRSFKKFIQDQDHYQQNKEMKIKQFKTEINKIQANQYTCRPSIDKVSNKICSKMDYTTKEVFERLSKQKILPNSKEDEELFTPKILHKSKSLKRNQTISELLHCDALRRQQKRQMSQNKKTKEQEPQTPLINTNTNNFVVKKLYSQFCQLIGEDEVQVPLVLALTVLSQIFNLQLSQNQKNLSTKIFDQIRHYLCEENTEETVQREKLWEFIEIIILRGQTSLKYFSTKSQEIMDKLGDLYFQRLTKGRKQLSPPQDSFHPSTLKRSDKYAEKYREKILTEAQEFIKSQEINFRFKEEAKLEDLYMADYLMRRASNEKKKIKEDQLLLKQCTFQPKLYSSKYSIQNRKENIKEISKSKLTNTKTHQETETIKSASLCNSMITNVLKFKQTSKEMRNKNGSVEVKNSEKEILRMSIGRKNREFFNQIKDRGYPKDVQNWNLYTKKQKQKMIQGNKKLKGYSEKKIILK